MQRPPVNAPDSAALPAFVLAMQAQAETLYLAKKTLELAHIQLMRGTLVRRPCSASWAMRAAMRLVPPLARARQAKALRHCGLFDAQWYLERNPDVRASGADPAKHYLVWGARDGRNPGPLFDTNHYLRLYPDVRAAGVNPLLHYITIGWDERRSAHPGAADGSG